MLALISTINGKSIKEKFKSIEEEICLGENCKEIIKALFDYVFMTILSILSFLSFIPSYFTAMANLANVTILTKKKNQRKKERTVNLTKRRKTKMSENDAKKNKHRFKDIEKLLVRAMNNRF